MPTTKPADTLTEQELAQLKREEMAAAERAKYKDDKIVSGFAMHDGPYFITAMGRIFRRMHDTKVSNDGRGGERYVWRQVELPF